MCQVGRLLRGCLLTSPMKRWNVAALCSSVAPRSSWPSTGSCRMRCTCGVRRCLSFTFVRGPCWGISVTQETCCASSVRRAQTMFHFLLDRSEMPRRMTILPSRWESWLQAIGCCSAIGSSWQEPMGQCLVWSTLEGNGPTCGDADGWYPPARGSIQLWRGTWHKQQTTNPQHLQL